MFRELIGEPLCYAVKQTLAVFERKLVREGLDTTETCAVDSLAAGANR